MLIGPAQRPTLPDVPPSSANINDIYDYLRKLDRYLQATVASMVNTTNIAGLQGLSGTGLVENNFRGSVNISGSATAAVVSLPHLEPNTSYFLWLTPHFGTGTPPLVTATWTGPLTTSFLAVISGAPGTSNSIQVDWVILR
jgi:hypothetical protein